ncbi:MAG TPA: 6-carboxytetrahydropterin synthase [Abditibacteriaceae bacterium]|jgi:6-pyruvoyltetrahydropterin/6-carboxytetrahydropterin synthase
MPTVSICRRAFFSSGRRLFHPDWTEERNHELFGRDVLPHGENYALDVFYAGPVNERDGMIANLTDMKPVIADAIAPLEGAWLPDDVEHFASLRPTTENLVKWIWTRLPARIGGGQLSRLTLAEGTKTCAAFDGTVMKITRKYEFAAAHRLHMPHESEDLNAELYGKCNNPRGHGHNYGLEVTVEGEPDAETGTAISAIELDRIVDEEVFERFDHKHLNEDCPEFRELIPTSENLARVIFDVLQPKVDNGARKLARIGLNETQKNYFEVEA